jgi:hypothetical protein
VAIWPWIAELNAADAQQIDLVDVKYEDRE